MDKDKLCEIFEEEEGERPGGFPNLDRFLKGKKRQLVNYAEGARMYRIPYYSFVRLAREAEAHFCMRKTSVVDVGLIEKYLAEHPDVAERINSVREV